MTNRILLNNVSADVISDELELGGGPAVLIVRGDEFDGGSVLFQVASNSDSENRFKTLDNGIFTDAGNKKIDYLPGGLKIRAELSGAGGSASNVFAEIKQ